MDSTRCARWSASNSLTGTSWRQHAPQPARQEIALPFSEAHAADIAVMASVKDNTMGSNSRGRRDLSCK